MSLFHQQLQPAGEVSLYLKSRSFLTLSVNEKKKVIQSKLNEPAKEFRVSKTFAVLNDPERDMFSKTLIQVRARSGETGGKRKRGTSR